jgi:hypothetical protein
MSGTGIRYTVGAIAIGCAVLSACSSTVDGDPEPSRGVAAPRTRETPAGESDTGVKVTHPKRIDSTTTCQAVLSAAQVGRITGWDAKDSGYSDGTYCQYAVTPSDSAFGAVSIDFVGRLHGRATELKGNTAYVSGDEFTCGVEILVTEHGDPDRFYVQVDITDEAERTDEECRVAEDLAVEAFDNLPDE